MERKPTDYTTEPLSALELLRLAEYSRESLRNSALYHMLGNRGLLNLLETDLDSGLILIPRGNDERI